MRLKLSVQISGENDMTCASFDLFKFVTVETEF